MSDFRAIGGVSGTLQALLIDRMELPGGVALGGLHFTIGLPHAETPPNAPPTPESPRINLFLYQVTESPVLANQDLPGRGHPAAYGNPPLSLNLHYLVTAYGSNTAGAGAFLDETQAQLLLGSAMRVLHDYPIITDSLLTLRPPVGRSILHPSLRGAFERLKISLDPVSIEDLTKIWTALTIPYRLSAAYSVSVIQIESRRSRRYPQLVGELPTAGPRITVIPLQTPFIQSLTVHRQGDPPGTEQTTPYARVGDTLIIAGQNLAGGSVVVAFDDLELPVAPVSGQRIEIVVPDASHAFGDTVTAIPSAKQLQPGPHTVEVRVAPAQLPQAAAASNRAVMMVTPHVQAVAGIAPRTVTIAGTRLYTGDLDSQTLVGQVLFDADSYDSATSTSIQLTLPDSLPFRAARTFLSTPQAAFPAVGTPPEIKLTIGGGPAQTVQLAVIPTSFTDMAAALQDAIRSVPGADMSYRQARVAAMVDRLAIVPGGLTANVTVANTPDAAALGLTTFTVRAGYLSGVLAPFPVLTRPPGTLRVTLGATTRDVVLPAMPTSLADAAQKLQAVIRASSGVAAFVNALVLPLVDQLLIVPGANVPVDAAGVAGVDETTVAELQLRAQFPVRVRVNGVEGIGGVNRIELPL